MKIVIDIPDEAYELLKSKRVLDNIAESVIANGTPYEERPQGEWIEHYDSSDGFTWLTCSRCMFKAYEEDYNCCPNCGASMIDDGGQATKI